MEALSPAPCRLIDTTPVSILGLLITARHFLFILRGQMSIAGGMHKGCVKGAYQIHLPLQERDCHHPLEIH